MPTSLTATLTTAPRRALLLLGTLILVAAVLGGPVAGKLTSSGGFVPSAAESQVALHQIERATGTEPVPGVIALTAPGTDAAGVAARLRAVPGVADVRGPAPGPGGRRVVTADLRAGADDTTVAKAALAAFAGHRDVTLGGPAVASEQIGSTVTADLGRAELLALPLLVLLSLLFFRGRATVLPLVVGLGTIVGTFLVLRGVNTFYGLNIYVLNLVVGLGLGLGVDYTLFLVTRFREELAAGRTGRDAVQAATSHAGRAIAFSALTVAAALASLTVFPQGFLRSMGIGGAVVAVVAAAVALSVGPALLALWGDRLARPVPGGDGRWHRLAAAVMRRPAVVAAATTVLMAAIAATSFGVHWTPVDSTVIPSGDSARTVAAVLQAGHDTRPAITVAVSAAPSQRPAVLAYAAEVGHVGGVTSVDAPRDLSPSLWQVDAHVAGDPAGAPAQAAVAGIRSLHPPFAAAVTGDAATFADQQHTIGQRLPLAVALLALLTFAVLWIMTDSVVLPLKALVMNTLTVGAALAPLVAIYQHGRLSGLLGYTSNGGVEPTDFLVAAALIFALSTDYGVFLLARIKEAHDAGQPDREAVVSGLGASGRVVTAAAILLAVAIGAFATSRISFIQEIGVATATGVLLDAFVVRTLLVPSLMGLLGEANWWSPRPMRAARRLLVGQPRAALR